MCGRHPFRLLPLFVEASQCGLPRRDLDLELYAVAAAVPPVEILELTPGCGEPIGGPGTLPLKLPLLPEAARVSLVAPSCLVERKWLDGGTLEGPRGALRRST